MVSTHSTKSSKYQRDINFKYYDGLITHIWIVGNKGSSESTSIHNSPFLQLEHDFHHTLANVTCYLQQFIAFLQNVNSNHKLEEKNILCAPVDLCAVIRPLNERMIDYVDQFILTLVAHFIPADENQVHRERLIWI